MDISQFDSNWVDFAKEAGTTVMPFRHPQRLGSFNGLPESSLRKTSQKLLFPVGK